METAGAVSVEVRANFDPLTRDLVNVKSKLDQFSRENNGAKNSVDVLGQSLDGVRRTYDSSYASQAKLSEATRVYNQAVSGGIITHRQASTELTNIKDKLGLLTGATAVSRQATQGLQSQMLALSAGAGPAGTLLAAFGPWGLAAAAGIGAASVAFDYTVAAAERMGQKSVDLRTFALTTGLTIDQIRALGRAATELGVPGESLQNWVERFTVNLDAARNGTGPLAEGLRKVGGGLLEELQATKNAAQAWDVFAKATDRAGESRNKLVREALGRGSAEAGLVLSYSQQAGGLDALVERMAKYNKGTADQVEQWAKLSIEVTAARKQADNAFAKVFTTEVLTAEAEFYRGLTSIIDKLKEISGSDILGTLSKVLYLNPITAAAKIGFDYTRGQGVATQEDKDFSSKPTSIAQTTAAINDQKKALDGQAISATAAYNNMKVWMDVLGPAATSEEKLALQTAELASKQEALKNSLSQDVVDRVRAFNKLTSENADLQTKVGLLGELAKVSDQVKVAADNISLAQMRNIQFTQQEITGMKERARLQAESSKPENQIAFEREMLSLTDQERAVRERIRGLNIDFNSSRGQSLAAQLKYNEELKISQDLIKTAATDFRATFVSELQNGVGAWKAFEKAGLTALGNIANKLADMALQNLAVKAFGGVNFFNLFGGAPGSSSPISVVGMNGPLATPTFHSGGIAGTDQVSHRYVSPAHFENAPRFHSGYMPWGSDEMGAIIRKDEGIFTPAQMRALGGGGSGGGSQSSSAMNIKFSIDLTGANGDEAIERAVNRGVGQGMQMVLAKVPGISVKSVTDARGNSPTLFGQR